MLVYADLAILNSLVCLESSNVSVGLPLDNLKIIPVIPDNSDITSGSKAEK